MKEFTLGVPISKVDEEKRMVWGYATVEELDSQGDIVDYEASKSAFGAWIGNIREMHDAKKAIGKKVEMQFDDATKGVWVGAKISESADGENAWTKVKEGVLAGFSIGGKVNAIVKDTTKVDGADVEADRITDYDLTELSLVDNPACPSAMLAMVKSVDGHLERTEELTVDPGATAPTEWWQTFYKFSPSQSLMKNHQLTDNENMKAKEVKKSLYTADWLIDLACDLDWIIRGEADSSEELKGALATIKAAIATELNDGEAAVDTAVIEMATQAINLKKESKVGDTQKDVVGGVTRDDNAEVVEDNRPEDTVAVEPVAVGTEAGGKSEEVGKPEVEKPAGEGAAPNEAAVAVTPEPNKEEKKDPTVVTPDDKGKSAPVEFTKAADSIIKAQAAMSETLGKVVDKLGEVAKSQDALKGEVDELKGEPAPTKPKASFTRVEKADGTTDPTDEDKETQRLLKRADELAVSPLVGTPLERAEVAEGLLLRRPKPMTY